MTQVSIPGRSALQQFLELLPGGGGRRYGTLRYNTMIAQRIFLEL